MITPPQSAGFEVFGSPRPNAGEGQGGEGATSNISGLTKLGFLNVFGSIPVLRVSATGSRNQSVTPSRRWAAKLIAKPVAR